jgi:hypothetical protein
MTVYLQSTDQPEWLVVLERLDKSTVVISCTDYSCLFSNILPDNIEWLFKDTRPVTNLKVTSIGPKLRADMTGLSTPILLDAVQQASALRTLLQSLTLFMFTSYKGAGKAERLSEQLEEIKESSIIGMSSVHSITPSSSGGSNKADTSSSTTSNANAKKVNKPGGHSLLNPRVRKARVGGNQFADDEEDDDQDGNS